MSVIRYIRNEAQIAWSLASDGTKAALRTCYQNVQAALIIALFAVATAAISWLSGADIDMLDVIATGRSAVGVAALAGISGVRAFYMNRGDKGARYP